MGKRAFREQNQRAAAAVNVYNSPWFLWNSKLAWIVDLDQFVDRAQCRR